MTMGQTTAIDAGGPETRTDPSPVPRVLSPGVRPVLSPRPSPGSRSVPPRSSSRRSVGGRDGPVEAVLLTDSADLADAVLALAAAAGCPVHRSAVGFPREGGGPGALVLVDAGTDTSEVARLRRTGAELVQVGLAPVEPTWWTRAATVDVDHTAVLPEAAPWLLERLTDLADLAPAGADPAHPGLPTRTRDGAGGSGRTVGVMGGRGGAGASVLAAALAVAGAEAGLETLLLDTDPHSGGVDLLLGGDELPGLRWPDLAEVDGRLPVDVLRGVVQLAPGLGVLPQGRHGGNAPGPAALRSVVSAARRGHELVVVDLPRPSDPPSGGASVLAVVGPDLDDLLVVVPSSVRAAAAACGVLDQARDLLAPACRPALVLRRGGPDGPAVDDVADAVGLPVAGVMRSERDLDARLERGEGLPVNRRSPLRMFAARWLAEVGVTR